MGLEEAFGDEEPTEAQQEVLEVAERNPDMKQKEIAEVSGWSESTVSTALQKHGDPAGEGRGSSGESESGGALKWIILIALVIGVLAMLDQGNSDGVESLLLIAVYLERSFSLSPRVLR